MQFITQFCPIRIITNLCSIADTKLFARLLTDRYAFCCFAFAEASAKFVRVCVCFNSHTEFLCGYQIQVFEVICVNWRCFRARRRFSNACQTIPCNTFSIFAAILHRIQNPSVDTGFIKTFADLVPFKFEFSIHILFLLNSIE